MKRITIDEFGKYLRRNEERFKLSLSDIDRIDQQAAVQRARTIFIQSGITNNISTAYEMYQELLAERDRELIMKAEWKINGNPRSIMDRYERPKCPECDADMLFRLIPANVEGVNTQLVCGNKECSVVLDSEMTIRDWMNVLEKKEEASV